MHATDAKTQKIEPDPNFFWQTKVSEAVCKRDWHNVRSYLFFNVRKFRTKISDSVFRDLSWMNVTKSFRVVFQPKNQKEKKSQNMLSMKKITITIFFYIAVLA